MSGGINKGPASPKEARKIIAMEQGNQLSRSAIQPVNVQSMYPQPLAMQNHPEGGIEVIDLDDSRSNVKPTTWHRK